jgi:hypothetical protein
MKMSHVTGRREKSGRGIGCRLPELVFEADANPTITEKEIFWSACQRDATHSRRNRSTQIILHDL